MKTDRCFDRTAFRRAAVALALVVALQAAGAPGARASEVLEAPKTLVTNRPSELYRRFNARLRGAVEGEDPRPA